MPGPPVILCLNAGSSSLKFSVWSGEECLGQGEVEEIGRPGASARLTPTGGPERRLAGQWTDHGAAVAAVFALLGEHALPEPAGVGHRLVHGGARHVAPERVTEALLGDLRALVRVQRRTRPDRGSIQLQSCRRTSWCERCLQQQFRRKPRLYVLRVAVRASDGSARGRHRYERRSGRLVLGDRSRGGTSVAMLR